MRDGGRAARGAEAYGGKYVAGCRAASGRVAAKPSRLLLRDRGGEVRARVVQIAHIADDGNG